MTMEGGDGICICIGGGICGLLTAASVAPFFTQVIILEKDVVSKTLEDYNSQEPDKRSGVLQWQHPHGVAAGGLVKLETLLPGFKACCEREGAYIIGEDGPINDLMMQTYIGRAPLAPGTYSHPDFIMTLGSRPLLERCARHLVLEQHPNIELRTGVKVTELLWGDREEQELAVTGVRIRGGEDLRAALVIETSGASCQAVADVLESKGCGVCESSVVDPGLNYYTRCFRVPEKVRAKPRQDVCHFAMHSPTPPDSSGRMFIRVEDDIYQANVAMLNKQKIGPEVADFLECFKMPHAPDPVFYEALKDAEPVGPLITWLGYPGTIKRYWERLRMPQNYLILGDAVASLNPRFGTGISMAAYQAEMLGQVLSQQRHSLRAATGHAFTRKELHGVTMQAQKQAAAIVNFAHSMVADGDLQFEFTKGPRSKNPVKHVLGKYMNWAMELICRDTEVAQTILLVTAFSVPPTSVFKPAIARKILGYGLQRAWSNTSQVARACIAVLCLLLAVGVAQVPILFKATRLL